MNTLTSASPTSIKARLRSERGAELIEFALVFPVLLMVVLGIVDFGFLFQRMEVVTYAAREGARLRCCRATRRLSPAASRTTCKPGGAGYGTNPVVRDRRVIPTGPGDRI